MTVGALTAISVPDPSAPHLSLWNSQAFYDQNPDARERRLQVDHHTEDGRLVGSFVGAQVEDRWISGFSAPMGGVDFVRSDEVPRHVIDLVHDVFERAASASIARVEIRMKPAHHGPAEAHLLFALLTAGARVALTNLNFFVDVSEPGGLQPRARKAARRAADRGWTVNSATATDEPAWAEAYAVIERNRRDKGRPMRLSLDYVRGLRDRLPMLVRMQVVRDADGEPVAAALVYRTEAAHDVVQYWGDIPTGAPVSPMPLLAEAVFDAAREAGARHVDLGISTDDGQPNHGLIQFKRSVGARTEVRLELVADVAEVLASDRWERLRG